MIAPFYPMSYTHHPLRISRRSLDRRSFLRFASSRFVLFSLFLSLSLFLSVFSSFALCPPVNKAEAGVYLTFIRFGGESASLTRKEARVERTLQNVTRRAFHVFSCIFRRSRCSLFPLALKSIAKRERKREKVEQ